MVKVIFLLNNSSAFQNEKKNQTARFGSIETPKKHKLKSDLKELEVKQILSSLIQLSGQEQTWPFRHGVDYPSEITPTRFWMLKNTFKSPR